MQRKDFLSAGAGALAALAAPASAIAQILPGQRFAQQLTIGVSVPLSGDLIRQGEQVADGVRAAILETNGTGGPLDRVFGMRTFDDMGALASAITNVQFAASDSTIIGMIGNLQGSVTLATLPQYGNVQMPLVVPVATTDGITEKGYRNVWRLPTKDSVEGNLYARYISSAVKPKNSIAVTQDGDYGYDVAQGFVAAAKSAGMQADTYVFPFEKPDFALAAKTVLTKTPDFIYLCGKTKDMGPLIPALRAAGFAGKFGACDGFYDPTTIKEYGDKLAPFTLSSSLPPLDRAPGVFQILQDFRAHVGELTPLSSFGYAAAQIIISAARRTGATNRLALMSALRAPSMYQTLVGDFQFTPNGDPIDPNVYFYTIADGKFKFVKPAHPSGFIL
ncbi:MAG TPA: branched-chain amino acid ABC transporter substrate-binding protein [Candidatus Baltobacteraceae bacterium]|jgi:ABC-type branched-subunit amino acid transport system substrate-binding protein